MCKLFRMKSFYIVLVILAVLIYIFFPRNVIWLMPNEIRENSIEIFCLYRYDDGETRTIGLSARQQKEMIDLFSCHYARLKPIREKYVNSTEMGYTIIISGSTDEITFWSEKIIVINGVQYEVYGESLAEQFKELIESEENLP